nr:hypothetical protein [Tanacetum cinerariifolium]
MDKLFLEYQVFNYEGVKFFLTNEFHKLGSLMFVFWKEEKGVSGLATSDVDPTDEDGDIRMGDSTGVSASLDGEIFSGGKKCQESNIGDSDNTADRGKIVAGICDSLA